MCGFCRSHPCSAKQHRYTDWRLRKKRIEEKNKKMMGGRAGLTECVYTHSHTHTLSPMMNQLSLRHQSNLLIMRSASTPSFARLSSSSSHPSSFAHTHTPGSFIPLLPHSHKLIHLSLTGLSCNSPPLFFPHLSLFVFLLLLLDARRAKQSLVGPRTQKEGG